MPALLCTAVSTTQLSAALQYPVTFRTKPTSIGVGGSAPSLSVGTYSGLILDQAGTDQALLNVQVTGVTANQAVRYLGNADATTYIEFLGVEL
jgi:hypothetical protein